MSVTPELAISNNVALYRSIFRAHRLVSGIDEHYWSTDAEPPPYYSRLVTRTRGARALQAQLTRLEEVTTRVQGRSCGCKDSYDELPEDVMARLGLRRLFRAWWYGLAEDTLRVEPEIDFVAQHVRSPEALQSWEEAWRQSSPAGASRIFPDAILEDQDLELFAVDLRGRMAGGFMLNRSDAAVGLSNVFQIESSELPRGRFLRECARHARRLHADRAVVGYGPLSEIDDLARVGVVPLGPLAVWTSA